MSLRVSVVIPAYKAATWIEATLESVVRQTYPRHLFEIIVVDDASPDDGAAIARRFLGRHSVESRVIHCPVNGGVSTARNIGWRASRGDWVQFLDADDLLAPHKLELQTRYANGTAADVAVVYSNWQDLSLQNGEWKPVAPLHAPFVDEDPLLQILQDLNFGYVGPTLVRRLSLDAIGGFDERPTLGEDCDLMLRLAMAGQRFRKAPCTQAAFFYRLSPNSLWRVWIRDVEAMRNQLYGYRRVDLFLRQRYPDGLPEAARFALARRYSRFVDQYAQMDPESFRLLMTWLRGLGLKQPTDLTPRMRLISSAIGYENAFRLRSTIRTLARGLRLR